MYGYYLKAVYNQERVMMACVQYTKNIQLRARLVQTLIFILDQKQAGLIWLCQLS